MPPNPTPSRTQSARPSNQPPPHHHGGRGGRFAAVEHAKDPVSTLKRLLPLLKGRWRFLALLTVPLLVSALAGLVWPYVLGRAIDVATLKSPSDSVDFYAFGRFLLIGLAAQVVGHLASVAQGYGTTLLSNHSVRDFRKMLFQHVQSLPISRFDTLTHGELMSRLTNDIDRVANTLGPDILKFVGTLSSLLGTLGFMLWISWKLTVVTCITLPLSIFLGRTIVRFSRKLYREQQKIIGELNGFAEEMITGQRVVQAFCHESIAAESFNTLSNRLQNIGIRAEILGGLMGPTMNLTGNLTFLLVVTAGGWLALQGSTSIGVIVAFMMYARRFGHPINEIASQFNLIQSAIAGAERVFTLLDMPPELDTGTTPLSRANIRGELVFEHVHFGYIPEKTILHDFCLTVQPGQKIALVGETGSGKTTLINLLTRFYIPQQGQIYLDGININAFPLHALRSCMAVVLQDTHLFSGTVAENIRFGATDASDEQMRAAAELANADVFINRLPQGYDTPIHQTDTALSQGQCQLLAIARAALANPAILILDEATSNVDTRTEMHIQQAMIRLMKGRTSIIIAHRLSTIRDADLILVLDQGRIVESGTHESLLAQKGAYAALCQRT